MVKERGRRERKESRKDRTMEESRPSGITRMGESRKWTHLDTSDAFSAPALI